MECGDILEGEPVTQGAHTSKERLLLVPDAYIAGDTGQPRATEQEGHKVRDGCKRVRCRYNGEENCNVPFL